MRKRRDSNKAEIDQSGKFEDLSTHSVVSISNHVSGSIYLSVTEKIKLIKFLRKTIVNRSDLVVSVFATIVYILIIKFGKNFTRIKIDEEYTGRQKFILEQINKLYLKNKKKKEFDISFTNVGKQSSAHKLAWKIHRKKLKKEALVLKYEDILGVWGIK